MTPLSLAYSSTMPKKSAPGKKRTVKAIDSKNDPPSPELVERLRQTLSSHEKISEKKMFGGYCFLHRGNMLCGVTKDSKFMVRVGKEKYDDVLARKHASKMTFTGREMRGMIYVDAAGYATSEQLEKWVQLGLEFTSSLPEKAKKGR